jgi:hypothetical protein
MKITIDTEDIQSIATAIAEGLTTPERMADWIGDDDAACLVNGNLVLRPGTWRADDGNAEIEIAAETAGEAAREYLSGGDWGEPSETSWVHVWVWRTGVDADGDIVDVERESHRIAIEPSEPDCTRDDGHDWIDGEPRGSGGGVYYRDTCRHCRCVRLTDTWAQDRATGEQGLTSVSYSTGDDE